MESIVQTLSEALYEIGFLPILVFVYFLGLLIFWFESKQVKKDSNSIFDQWFITTIISLLFGRLGYIFARWDDFSSWYWFWSPYEKYGDQIYLFRAMPWRIFSIWDGGFLIIAMFLVYTVASYLYAVIFKRWRWKEMMVVILIPANFMLAAFLFVYGLFLKNESVAESGMNILLFVLSFEVLIILLKIVYKKAQEQFLRVAQILSSIFLIGDIILVSYIFLPEEISSIEKYSVYGFIIFGIFMLAGYIYDIKRADPLPKGSSFDGPKHSITLNQAIKVSNDK